MKPNHPGASYNSRMSDDSQIEAIISEWERRHRLGEFPSLEQLCPGRPDLVEVIRGRMEGLVTIVPPGALGATMVQSKGDSSLTSGNSIEPPVTDISDGTIAQSAEKLAESQAVSLGRGELIPGYDGLEELGRGGIGVVYRARQLKPNRVVALKMMIGGAHAGAANTARFLDEAEAIARLRHPNIVQIYEAGTHHDQPYFTLEYCDGGSLKDKLAGQPLPPRQAAALVEVLARAMHAAHDDGIIHRDLKPANILLSRLHGSKSNAIDPKSDWTLKFDPWNFTPKVADFGLAKLEGTELTATGAIMGTPSYMAPEQAQGQTRDVGPHTDVWALGAILYECLTGRPPFRAATQIETLRQVVDADPVPPSQLNPSVLPDLETVCLACLRKEKDKRYGSALELADDLRRFLEGRPVTARPVRTIEHMWRWCRRNRALSSAIAAAATFLILGAGLSIAFGIRASRNESKALKAAEQERQAKELAQGRLNQLEKANDLLGSLFRDLDPKSEEKGGLPLRAELSERLEQAARQLDGEAIADSLTMARLQDTLGRSQTSLGNPKHAIDLLQRAHASRQTELGPDHAETLSSLVALARAHHEAGDAPKAVTLGEEALAKLKSARGPDHAETLTCMSNLALACRAAGQAARARFLDEETHQRRLATVGVDHADTITSMSNLAGSYFACGEYSKGLPLFEQALTKRQAKHGPDHFLTLRSLNNLAGACLATGQRERALQLYEQAFEKMKQTLGPDHPSTLLCMRNMAGAYQTFGQLPRALALFAACFEKYRDRLGPDHPDTLACTRFYALALHQAGNQKRAAELIEETAEKLRSKHGPDHPQTLEGTADLAWVYLSTRQIDKARSMLETTLRQMEAKLPADHPATLNCMNFLARAYQESNDNRAGDLMAKALAKMTERLGPDHPDTLTCMQNLGRFQFRAGQTKEGLELLERVLEKRRVNLGADHPQTLNGTTELARACLAAGNHSRAVQLLEPAVELFQGRLGPNDIGTLFAILNLGRSYMASGQIERAAPHLDVALSGYRKLFAGDSRRLADLLSEVAVDMRKYGQPARAEALELEAKNLRGVEKPADSKS